MTARTSAALSALAATLILTACAPAVPHNPSGGDSSADGMTASSSSLAAMEASSGEHVSSAAAAASRVVAITAGNFAFTPAAVVVRKGEKVTLRLTGAEGSHGLAIPGLGISTVIPEGKTVDIELPTDAAGTFDFFCSVSCGPEHRDMKGTITIME